MAVPVPVFGGVTVAGVPWGTARYGNPVRNGTSFAETLSPAAGLAVILPNALGLFQGGSLNFGCDSIWNCMVRTLGEKILYHVEKEFLGDGLIDPVMHDKYIEDISCDGVGSPIFVYHTTYESMRTSLVYRNAGELDSFVTKLAQRAGKYISIAEPMLDATMTDGSRIQMTLGSEVTAHGSTFTIRKFRDEPITPTDLIEWHTFSPLGIAFLWLAVENAKSCIFAGGTASGKTTTLNAISLFIPPLAKIVTLEDTRELKLPHPTRIRRLTRASFSQTGRGERDRGVLLRPRRGDPLT